MPRAAVPQASVIAAVLAAALAMTGCEPPPPVELGPQGSGGIVSGVASRNGPAPDTAGDADATAAAGDVTADATGTEAPPPAATAGSLLDGGKGAAFAANLVADDARYFQQAELSARTALIGSTITWRNPGSGTVGTITPLADRTIGGQECRDFFLTATIGGRQRSETATACKVGDNWAPRV
jgi:surface antigen